jgi:hypothetical protein
MPADGRVLSLYVAPSVTVAGSSTTMSASQPARVVPAQLAQAVLAGHPLARRRIQQRGRTQAPSPSRSGARNAAPMPVIPEP